LQCKPCGIHGHRSCPKKHFKCGTLISSGAVIKKAEVLLYGK
jgi:heptosyltransferase II